MIGGLKRGDCPIPSLFADERWNAAPFRGTVGNMCCTGMDWLVLLKHGQALSGSQAQFLICSFWGRVLEQRQTCCWTWS